MTLFGSIVVRALQRHTADKALSSKEGEGILNEARTSAEKALGQIHSATGVSWIVVIGVGLLLVGLVALLFDSSQGRGRRYRRGYSVAYREELGKQRARMRAKQEQQGIKKPGWRERTGKPVTSLRGRLSRLVARRKRTSQ